MPSRSVRLWALCALVSFGLPAKEPVKATHGMVGAQEPLAADVGLTVLKNGGNAVDAAVAVGFALAVTHPVAGNIGGGGFMLVRLANGTTDFLDFRECAPAKASRDMYLGPNGNPTRESIYGWKSAGVPGTVAGLELAHKKFGSQDWKSLVTPAVGLAKDGFTLTEPVAAALRSENNPLNQDPESKRIFLRDGNPYKTGEVLKQPELASTLDRIARQGAKGFYRGETAKKLTAEMAAHGGFITESDLQDYKVIERLPLTGTYHGYNVITAPPPSAGGVGLLQMMGMLTGTTYESDGPNSPKAVHFVAEAMRRFYADRSEYLGDPDFYNVPVRQLLDPAYLTWRRGTIDPERATPSELIGPGLPKHLQARVSWYESKETTHYNVVDAKGNAVAVTYTLNNSYGNGITVPGLGFLLNDEMDDFAAKPGAPNMFGMVGADANAIEPGKRPLSSMTPTIITKGSKLEMVVGAPGGSRITTGVAEVIFNVLDFGLNAQDAVDLPRFHLQWKPDVLYLQTGFPLQTEGALRAMGYDVKPTDNVARVEAIVVNNGTLEGGTESRLHGKVAGY
ncbi:MAG: gamma-glutamyltransferase [Acidobacteriaceae bacterium]|nr:gamma-glutamyltransferase [Acidobacteriaceae bacterium]